MESARGPYGSRDASALRIYGCTQSDALILNDGVILSKKGTKGCAYGSHYANAARRGIPWNFTFATWLDFWLVSGKWAERGNQPGQYVMARHGDVGPYSIDNVSICSVSSNARQAWANGRCKFAPSGLGKGRGWTIDPGFKTNPYLVRCGDYAIGRYPTQEMAEVAYQAAVTLALAIGADDRRIKRHRPAAGIYA